MFLYIKRELSLLVVVVEAEPKILGRKSGIIRIVTVKILVSQDCFRFAINCNQLQLLIFIVSN